MVRSDTADKHAREALPELSERDRAHIAAALRYWGRAAETSKVHPRDHFLCVNRLKGHPPMSLHEIESLIGRIDGSWPYKKALRFWEPLKELEK